MKNLGRRIASIRKNRGLTQEELAAAAGTSRAYLARVETDVQTPSLEVIERISTCLSVPAGVLLLDRDNLPPGPGYTALGRALDNLIELTTKR